MSSYFVKAVEDAKRLEVVPVIGAGLSVPLGQPSWNDLADEVAEDVHLSLRRSDRVSAVEVLSQARKESNFSLAVQSAIHSARLTTTALQSLVHSTIDRIITTNLDYSIETAYEMAGKPLPSQNIGRGCDKEELVIFNAHPRGGTLLKIHGSLERPETWVLTPDDYNKAYIQTGNLTRFFSDRAFIPLFLGFSLNDFDIEQALRIGNVFTGKHGYMAVPRDKMERYKFKLEQVGILPLEIEDYTEIGPLIDKLFKSEDPELRYSESDKKITRIQVGAAACKLTKPVNSDDPRLSTISTAFFNAVEPRTDRIGSHCFNGRKFGLPALFREKLTDLVKKAEKAKQAKLPYDMLALDAITALARITDRVDEGFIKALIDESSVVLYDILEAIYKSQQDSVRLCENLDNLLLSTIDSEPPYAVLRDIVKMLGKREKHSAQSLEVASFTLRVDGLHVPRYPLTRFQVGKLLSEESLCQKNPLKPYTLSPKENDATKDAETRQRSALEVVDEILSNLAKTTKMKWSVPTREQWEQLARIGAGQIWPWVDGQAPSFQYANLKFRDNNTNREPVEVGLFRKGRSPDGLFDLIGNVYELVRVSDNDQLAPSNVKLAGGACTTIYPPRNGGPFNMFCGFSTGSGKIGIRPVGIPMDISKASLK